MPLGGVPSDIIAGDFDNNGSLDVIVAEDVGIVRQLLRAHEYWRLKQVAIDLQSAFAAFDHSAQRVAILPSGVGLSSRTQSISSKN